MAEVRWLSEVFSIFWRTHRASIRELVAPSAGRPLDPYCEYLFVYQDKFYVATGKYHPVYNSKGQRCPCVTFTVPMEPGWLWNWTDETLEAIRASMMSDAGDGGDFAAVKELLNSCWPRFAMKLEMDHRQQVLRMHFLNDERSIKILLQFVEEPGLSEEDQKRSFYVL